MRGGNGGGKAKDYKGTRIKGPWTKPKAGGIRGGRWGWVGENDTIYY